MKIVAVLTKMAHTKHCSYGESNATVEYGRIRHTLSTKVTKKQFGDIPIHANLLLAITKRKDTSNRLCLNPELSIKELYNSS